MALVQTKTRGLPPKTLTEFRRQAVAGFRKANPEAKGAKVEWLESRRVKWPTGFRGFYGEFTASAEGYRSKTMRASYVEGGGLMVR